MEGNEDADAEDEEKANSVYMYAALAIYIHHTNSVNVCFAGTLLVVRRHNQSIRRIRRSYIMFVDGMHHRRNFKKKFPPPKQYICLFA